MEECNHIQCNEESTGEIRWVDDADPKSYCDNHLEQIYDEYSNIVEVVE